MPRRGIVLGKREMGCDREAFLEGTKNQTIDRYAARILFVLRGHRQKYILGHDTCMKHLVINTFDTRDILSA